MSERLGNPNFLSEDHRAPLKPRTLVAREFHLRQFAAALVHRGYGPAELRTLKGPLHSCRLQGRLAGCAAR